MPKASPCRNWRKDVETPFYCYSAATIRRHYTVFSQALSDMNAIVCYAMKANSNQAVLTPAGPLGAGMDVVSEGELRRARAAGVPGERIIFSGVGKTDREIALALDYGIFCFNVESEPELERISQIATAQVRTASISLRVNPDVDAKTTPRSQPASRRTSLASPFPSRATSMPGVETSGPEDRRSRHAYRLADHRSRAVRQCFRHSCRTGPATARRWSRRSPISTLAAASEFPILNTKIPRATGRNSTPKWFAAIYKPLGARLLFEPGRLIVGNAGVLVTRVIYVKRGAAKNFVIVDAAMNDLVRPTLYEAHHDIFPVVSPDGGAAVFKADIVGPVCETGDYLALGREMAEPRPGRPARGHVGRRLWRGPGGNLQLAPARAGSSGRWRQERGNSPARRLRRPDRTRHNSDVVDINPFFGAKLTFRERGGKA